MSDPLRMSFDVACPADHAFSVWTSDIGTWWPHDHTVTGRGDVTVVLECRVGGRIFERTPEGDEHDWGAVTVFDRPSRLAYLWHLGGDRADATEVDVRFVAVGAGATRIEIEHRGWERLGTRGAAWRERNQAGWASLLPHLKGAM
jgi:hypothetical protein